MSTSSDAIVNLIAAMRVLSLTQPLPRSGIDTFVEDELLKNSYPMPNSEPSTAWSEASFGSEEGSSEGNSSLSESPTPVNDSDDDGEGVDIHRLTLMLYLVAGARGMPILPEWEEWRRHYERTGIGQDTRECCQRYKSARFSNDVANETGNLERR